MVDFLNLRRVNAKIDQELISAIKRVIDSGVYIGGDEVDRFEEEYAVYCSSRFCVGVASGLDALGLTLRAWMHQGVLQTGDEVIIPSNTFIASALACTSLGLVPVFVSPRENNYCVTVAEIEPAITYKTRVVMPVHLYGEPVPNIQELVSFASSRGLLVLEDAAQAHGAQTESGRVIGSIGDATAFSFYPGKNLGAIGDAGAVCTNDQELASLIRKIGNYGSKEKYVHDLPGVNSRLDPIQAAVLRVKLKYLDAEIIKRRAIAERYINNLAGSSLVLPDFGKGLHVFHLFVIRNRNATEIAERLSVKNVMTGRHYPKAIHDHDAIRSVPHRVHSSYSERALELLSLPMDPNMGISEVDQICQYLGELKL